LREERPCQKEGEEGWIDEEAKNEGDRGRMAQPSSKLLFHINNKQHGSGAVTIAWQAAGNYVATAGVNRQVHIYDRYGQVIDDVLITAGGAILCMDWDSEGETLAIMQQSNSALIFWDVATRKTNTVETNMKDLSWFKWNNNGPELAVGTVMSHPSSSITIATCRGNPLPLALHVSLSLSISLSLSLYTTNSGAFDCICHTINSHLSGRKATQARFSSSPSFLHLLHSNLPIPKPHNPAGKGEPGALQ
jgi:WD40 repeat protein